MDGRGGGQIVISSAGDGGWAYRFIAAELVHLLAQEPEIERLVIDGGHGHAGVALLLVKAVQLLEEVDLGAGRRLDGVEALQSRLEAEPLWRNHGSGGTRGSQSVSITLG